MESKERKCYESFQTAAKFFSSCEYALKKMQKEPDWELHTKAEWKNEYDALFFGTDPEYEIPLWASVFLDEKVLLNQTTLDVIHFYHKWGYAPSYIDGNPPDYIGEQFLFLSYLSLAIVYELEQGKDAEKLKQAREDFILYYTLGNMKAIYNAAKTCGTFSGYLHFFEECLHFLADEEHEFLLKDDNLPYEEPKKLHAPIEDEEPKQIPTAGLNNCGGICVIRPTVAEGCMLSIESDCSSNMPQIRACVRGRGYRKTYLSPKRLRCPMKRVGERGSGRFEKISWEEAIDLLHEKWVDIRGKYGPESTYIMYGTGVTGIMRPGILMSRLLSLDGGYLGFFNTYSSACVSYVTPYMFGELADGHSAKDLLNTKLLILWGHNPAETIFGPERNYYLSELKKRGVKIIAIDPRLNQTAASYADEWIAIRPATDAALADAMAYVIWSEGLQDQAFMDQFCLGFDEEHMPLDIDPNESYRSYLFGIKDGIKKTPKWAEAITGIDADVIIQLAREYATAKPACIDMGLGAQRHGNGEQTARGVCMLCCLTGNVGIPGGSSAGNGSVINERTTPMLFSNTIKNPYPGKISTFLWSRAIEHGTEMTPKDDRLEGVEKLNSNIKMIFSLASNVLINQHSDINNTIRILKDDSKCEFIVCSDIFMTASARYADLILPATSVFEGNNINAPWTGGNYLLRHNKVIEPLFESRFEWDWMCELADKLGYGEAFRDGKNEVEDWLRENYEILRKKEPTLPEYEEFCKRGGYQYKEQINHIPFYEQIHDPKHHPFLTPSGKIEIFSKQLYDFKQENIPAIPKYIPAIRGHEDPLKEKYPLQLVGWHTKRRCHSIHDNNEWQDEIEMPSVWINPKDAKARGIEDGDMVLIWNDIGKVRIPAKLTKRVMPGVTAMAQGAWYTPDKEGVDTRGSINVLTSFNPTPLAMGNPQHTNLVEICKADEPGESLE